MNTKQENQTGLLKPVECCSACYSCSDKHPEDWGGFEGTKLNRSHLLDGRPDLERLTFRNYGEEEDKDAPVLCLVCANDQEAYFEMRNHKAVRDVLGLCKDSLEALLDLPEQKPGTEVLTSGAGFCGTEFCWWNVNVGNKRFLVWETVLEAAIETAIDEGLSGDEPFLISSPDELAAAHGMTHTQWIAGEGEGEAPNMDAVYPYNGGMAYVEWDLIKIHRAFG